MLCDIFGYICFEEAISTNQDDQCDCPLECNSISYSYTFITTPLNPDETCPPGNIKNFLMKEFYEHKFPPEYIRNLRKFKDNVTSDQAEICKNNIKYRAKLTFKLATDTIQVTVSSKRLSFFDQLSGFGKYKLQQNFTS